MSVTRNATSSRLSNDVDVAIAATAHPLNDAAASLP